MSARCPRCGQQTVVLFPPGTITSIYREGVGRTPREATLRERAWCIDCGPADAKWARPEFEVQLAEMEARKEFTSEEDYDSGEAKQRLRGHPEPAKKDASRRIGSPGDVPRVLDEVMATARVDRSLSTSALHVLVALHETAKERRSIELAAARWWLMERTGLSEPAVRRALARLDKRGYLQILRPRQVTRRALKLWLRRRETGRPPTLVRLADRSPAGAIPQADQNPRPEPQAIGE